MRTCLRLTSLATLVVVGSTLAAGCGSDGRIVDAGPSTTAVGAGGSSTTVGSKSGPGSSDEVAYRVVVGGGFVPINVNLATVPALSIMGDGTAIVAGPETEQYPPHALPNLRRGSITGEDLAALIAKAEASGLLAAGPIDFGRPPITDMPTTTVTLVVEGVTHTLEAYALDFGTDTGPGTDMETLDPKAALTAPQLANRKALLALMAAASSAVRDDARGYLAERVTVYALPVPESAAGVVAPPKVAWPLDDPAAWPASTAGGPERCKTYAGAEATTAMDAARPTGTDTTWTSADGSHSQQLVFRPLLPDERDLCA